MGTKLNPGKFFGYDEARIDEPMFTLLARDVQAPKLVRQWAFERLEMVMNGTKPHTHIAKALEALKCADHMDAWRKGEEMLADAAKKSDPPSEPPSIRNEHLVGRFGGEVSLQTTAAYKLNEPKQPRNGLYDKRINQHG